MALPTDVDLELESLVDWLAGSGGPITTRGARAAVRRIHGSILAVLRSSAGLDLAAMRPSMSPAEREALDVLRRFAEGDCEF
jgi:hypothetical protein